MILIPLLLTPMCQSVWSHLKEVARIQHVSLHKGNVLFSTTTSPAIMVAGANQGECFMQNVLWKYQTGQWIRSCISGSRSYIMRSNVSMFHRFPNTCFVFPIVCRDRYNFEKINIAQCSSSRKQHFYGCAQSNVAVLSEKSLAKIEWQDLPDCAGLQGCRHRESSVHTFCEDCRHQTIL